jgi:FtsZ-interacting cell division protein ZipA
LSSILDALKKAEQESTPNPGAGTPWPAPLSPPSSQRQDSRHWWVALGVVVGLGLLAAVFWQTRQPNQPSPTDSVNPAKPLNKTSDSAMPLTAKRPQPLEPVAQNHKDAPTATMLENYSRPSAQNAPASDIQTPSAQVPPVPVDAVNAPSPAGPPEQAPPVEPEKIQPRRPAAEPEPQTTQPSVPVPSPVETTAVTGQTDAGPPAGDKTYRHDPRIELQALVWAPDAASRFVVINNRLIKEGGSVDNIVVVRIDQEDVLLAEGSDRWYEKFHIR